MKRLQSTVVLALLALGTVATASDYPFLDHRMLNTRDDPFRWYLDSRDPRPAGIDISSVESASRAAFDAWESVPGAYVDFQYMGRTSTNPQIGPTVGNPYDAFNVSTVWVNSSSDEFFALALASGAAPTGSIPLTYAGYLYQCDIYINNASPQRFRWTTVATTDPNSNFVDLQSALMHEIGHCMGLADVWESDAVMYSTLPRGSSRRTLTPHDQEHVSLAYPENGAVGSPCNASDPCTNGLSCIPRNGPDGGVVARYCTKACPNVSPGECPDPFVCRPSPIRDGGTVCLAVPNEAVTQVGKPCGTDPDCGGARGLCQQPFQLPSSGTAWLGGYCQQDCTSGGSASCPAGSECIPVGANASRCLKSCRVGTGDCREGYTCSPLAQGNVCVPNCYQDPDCPTGFTCRVCDRVCVQNTGTSRTVGDPCSVTTDCGVGQVCLKVNNQSPGVCAQPCSNATCSCPGGSSCLSVASERMCMRDCSPGTCPQGLECNPVGEGYACIPACQKLTDCPSGFVCNGGRCINPQTPVDGGCTLCSDGGPPPPPPPPVDGGPPGDDTPEGCGCSGGPGSALLFLAVIALLLMGGRHSWSRR